MKIEVTHIVGPVTEFERTHPIKVTLGPGGGGRYIQRTHLTVDEALELLRQLTFVVPRGPLI